MLENLNIVQIFEKAQTWSENLGFNQKFKKIPNNFFRITM